MTFGDLLHPGSKEAIQRNLKLANAFSDNAIEYLQKIMAIQEQAARELKQVTKTFRRKSEEMKPQGSANAFGLVFLREWEDLLREIEEHAVGMERTFGENVKTGGLLETLSEVLTGKRNMVKQMLAYREAFDRDVKKAEEDVNVVHTKLVNAFRTQANKSELFFHNLHNEYVLELAGYNGLAQGAILNNFLPGVMEDLEDVIAMELQSVSAGLTDAVTLIQDQWETACLPMGKFREAMLRTNVKNNLETFAHVERQANTLEPFSFPELDFRPPALKTGEVSRLPNELVRTNDTAAALAHTKGQLMASHADLVEKTNKLHAEVTSTMRMKETMTNNIWALSEVDDNLVRMHYQIRHNMFQVNHIESRLVMFGDGEDGYSVYRAGDTLYTNFRSADTLTNSNTSHCFAEHTYKTPTNCNYCHKLLVGLHKQGLHCKHCRMNVHRQCRDKVAYCTNGEGVYEALTKGNQKMKNPLSAIHIPKLTLGTRRRSRGGSGSDVEASDNEGDGTEAGGRCSKSSSLEFIHRGRRKAELVCDMASRPLPDPTSQSPSHSPTQSRAASPMRSRSPSPMRSRSPNPMRSRSPSPMRSRSPNPMLSRSSDPMRSRSPSPIRPRSRSPSPIMRSQSPSPMSRSSSPAPSTAVDTRPVSPSKTGFGDYDRPLPVPGSGLSGGGGHSPMPVLGDAGDFTRYSAYPLSEVSTCGSVPPPDTNMSLCSTLRQNGVTYADLALRSSSNDTAIRLDDNSSLENDTSMSVYSTLLRNGVPGTDPALRLSSSDTASRLEDNSSSETDAFAKYSSPVMVRKKTFLVAVTEYDPETDDDLALTPGDKIRFVSQEGLWTTGVLNGRTGVFPSCFARALNPDEKLYRVQYDFDAEAGDELSARKGHVLMSEREEETGWIYGTNISTGETGLFPSVYVKEYWRWRITFAETLETRTWHWFSRHNTLL